MTLDQLRVFIAVAESQHLTRAAHALDLAQSAVSKMIATLEGEIGFRLFDRVGRNIRLTNAGAAYRDEASNVLAAAARLTSWASTQRARMAAARVHKPPPATFVQHAPLRACPQGRKLSGSQIDHETRLVGSIQTIGHYGARREEV